MKTRFLFMICLWLAILLAAPSLDAQTEQRPENLLEGDESLVDEDPGMDEAAAPEAPASNVVDTSEDNFRRSMELRDATLQRSPDLTTGSYSRGTGLQALDDLPEESQKHLRGQLREVIVENGPWTPEEAGTEYPYVASEQAEVNPSLQRREEAAWGEMVNEYHEREAAIHANAARTEAASRMAGSPGAGNQAQGEPDGDSTDSQPTGQGADASQSQSENERAARAAALSEILNSPAAQAANGGGQPPSAEQGTEQNALELLTQRQQLPANAQPPTSVGVSVEAGESVQQETGETGEPGFILDTEGVIAIEDLDKVRVDPNDSDN